MPRLLACLATLLLLAGCGSAEEWAKRNPSSNNTGTIELGGGY